jgi:hypothetical protein
VIFFNWFPWWWLATKIVRWSWCHFQYKICNKDMKWLPWLHVTCYKYHPEAIAIPWIHIYD